MALKSKLSALAVLGLTVLFSQFFMITKHQPRLSTIIPFGEDPYDAIGSIALILSFLLVVLSLFRIFQAHLLASSTPLTKVLLTRTQIAVPLSVLVALGSDGVAMLRHPSAWTGKPGTGELIALLAGMAAASLAVLFFVRSSVREISLPAGQRLSRRAVAIIVGCAVTLALFPEHIIQNALLHFFAIAVGFVLLVAPQSALIVAILPYEQAEPQTRRYSARSRSRLWMQWGAVVILGIAVGAAAFIAEFLEWSKGSTPPAQILLVSSIFIAAGMSALLIAFAFLRTPLGLFRKTQS